MHILLQYRLIVLTKYSSGITQIAPLQVFENFRRRTPGPPFQSPPRFARRAAVCPSKTSHWVDMYDYRLLLFAPSIKRYSRNRIASKYHYHASAYSLQTICCRFIYLHEENANADDTDNSSRLPGWAGNHDRRSSTANQRNSSGRFRGHPHLAHSTTEGGRRCENAAALCNKQN